MLRRQPTRIALDMSDVLSYEERAAERKRLEDAERRACEQELYQQRMMQEDPGEPGQNAHSHGQVGGGVLSQVLNQGQGNRQKTRNERLGLGR